MPSTIWPWAEDNQGLLSLIALVSALSFALYENWRANNSEEKRRREFCRVAVDTIDEFINKVEMFSRRARNINPGDLKEFEETIDRFRMSFEDLNKVAPPDVGVMLTMAEIRQLMSSSRNWVRVHNDSGSLSTGRLNDLRNMRFRFKLRRGFTRVPFRRVGHDLNRSPEMVTFEVRRGPICNADSPV